MTRAYVARSTIVVFVMLTLQLTLLDSVRVSGAHPDMMLLVPVSAGLVGGPELGAAFGFATGLVVDLFLPTTFGLSALVGCLLGYAVGMTTSGVARSSWWLAPIVAAAATAAGMVGYAILGALLGQPQQLTIYLVPALSVATPAAAILAIPVLRFVAWGVPSRISGTAQSGVSR
ncbi:MAG: rod shape-determining protein MreD [Acidimicrobiales bacterium]